MFNNISDHLKNELIQVCESFKRELIKYSLNKINTSPIENINITYHGSIYKLNQLTSISIEKQAVIIKPFDKNIISTICKDIEKLNMDLTPSVYTDIIKVLYPKNTGERRQFFIKKVKELNEQYKINIRNIRRNTNNKIKDLYKNKTISQDEERRYINIIQKKIDDCIKKIDELTLKKNNDLKKI